MAANTAQCPVCERFTLGEHCSDKGECSWFQCSHTQCLATLSPVRRIGHALIKVIVKGKEQRVRTNVMLAQGEWRVQP